MMIAAVGFFTLGAVCLTPALHHGARSVWGFLCVAGYAGAMVCLILHHLT